VYTFFSFLHFNNIRFPIKTRLSLPQVRVLKNLSPANYLFRRFAEKGTEFTAVWQFIVPRVYSFAHWNSVIVLTGSNRCSIHDRTAKRIHGTLLALRTVAYKGKMKASINVGYSAERAAEYSLFSPKIEIN